jgi:hypothetical protein
MIIMIMVLYFQLLQETTVGLVFDIQRASRAHDFPVPYAESSCRLELYRLLHTLVLEPHSTWPPPTQFAFYMLSKGRSDPSLEVSSKWGASSHCDGKQIQWNPPFNVALIQHSDSLLPSQ